MTWLFYVCEDLFYYNTWKKRVLGAFWVTRMARENSTVWALNNLISTYLGLYLIDRKEVQNQNPFKMRWWCYRWKLVIYFPWREYRIEICILIRRILELPNRQRLSKFVISGSWTLARCSLLILPCHRGSVDSRHYDMCESVWLEHKPHPTQPPGLSILNLSLWDSFILVWSPR